MKLKILVFGRNKIKKRTKELSYYGLMRFLFCLSLKEVKRITIEKVV